MYGCLSQGLPAEAALRNGKRTLVLKRAGEDLGLARYFLQHGELDAQVKSRLAELCAVASIRPKPWQETKVGVASRVRLAEKHALFSLLLSLAKVSQVWIANKITKLL